jgi:hypothetical protein
MRRQRWGLVVGLLACAGGGACSAVLGGIEPGVLEDGGSSGSGPDGTTPDGTSPDGKARDGMVVVPEDVVVSGDGGCPAKPDPSNGVFVSQLGKDTPGCGSTETSSCLSIQEGLAEARSNNRPIVYVSAGTYAESITLYGGAHILGGYDMNWKPICKNTNAAVTIAPVTDTMTVVGSNLDSFTQIANLTIASKTTAKPGETIYGVFVTGSSATLELDNVIVNVVAGGDGMTGDMGSTGATGGSSCANGNGVSAGTPGGPGKNASAPSASASGYVSPSGNPGDDGTAGGNGVVTMMPTCVDCLTCKAAVTCNSKPDGMSCGTQGGAGCGGEKGGGGAGGQGGGSSIGVFLWNASATLQGGMITAGNGGAGGPGGSGGFGGKGGPTTMGAAGPSCTVTGSGADTCTTTVSEGLAGTNGPGGDGSDGGTGGGGAGGSSFAVYAGGSGSPIVSGTTLSIGSAGSGANGAPSGQAKASGP